MTRNTFSSGVRDIIRNQSDNFTLADIKTLAYQAKLPMPDVPINTIRMIATKLMAEGTLERVIKGNQLKPRRLECVVIMQRQKKF